MSMAINNKKNNKGIVSDGFKMFLMKVGGRQVVMTKRGIMASSVFSSLTAPVSHFIFNLSLSFL